MVDDRVTDNGGESWEHRTGSESWATRAASSLTWLSKSELTGINWVGGQVGTEAAGALCEGRDFLTTLLHLRNQYRIILKVNCDRNVKDQ